MERVGQCVVPGSPAVCGPSGSKPAQCHLPTPSGPLRTSERLHHTAPMQVLRRTAADCSSRWQLRRALRAVGCGCSGPRGGSSGGLQPPSAAQAVESSTAAAAPAVVEPPAQTSASDGAQTQPSRKPGGYPFTEIEAKWQRCGFWLAPVTPPNLRLSAETRNCDNIAAEQSCASCDCCRLRSQLQTSRCVSQTLHVAARRLGSRQSTAVSPAKHHQRTSLRMPRQALAGEQDVPDAAHHGAGHVEAQVLCAGHVPVSKVGAEKGLAGGASSAPVISPA